MMILYFVNYYTKTIFIQEPYYNMNHFNKWLRGEGSAQSSIKKSQPCFVLISEKIDHDNSIIRLNMSMPRKIRISSIEEFNIIQSNILTFPFMK